MSATVENVVSQVFAGHVYSLIGDITYKPGYSLRMDKSPEGRLFLQVVCWRQDAVTGEMGWGHGGKCYLSEYMSDQEIVQNTFGLFKSYEEHECREYFQYKGKRIYGPHMSLEALMEAADRTTYRVDAS